MRNTDLSKRQTRILDYVIRHINEHGYAPTMREIGRAVGISSSSVAKYNVGKLIEAGYLAETPTGKARTIVPVMDAQGNRVAVGVMRVVTVTSGETAVL